MTAELLQTRGLTAFYGDAQALYGVDLAVAPGEVIALIGANGAGKSTVLKSIVGQLSVPREQVRWQGEAIGGLAPEQIVRRGIAMVPEGRRLFPSLTVEENLLIGASARRAGPWSLAAVYELFPALRAKRGAGSMSLSGGQQQMVAIGRALMSNPQLLLCDEISLGLAPLVVREVYAALPRITAHGTAVVIVEQDVGLARHVSQRLYCLQQGAVSLQGESVQFTREQISAAYFGIDAHADQEQPA